AARADFGVMADEVVLSGLAHLLHPLQVRLVSREIGDARAAAGRGRALRGERAGDLLAHRAQPFGAALLAVERPGKLLLGEILTALAQRPQAFEGEAERRHDPGSRPGPRVLEGLNGCTSAVADGGRGTRFGATPSRIMALHRGIAGRLART